MTKTKKPTHQPSLPFSPEPDTLHQKGHWLWIPLRKEWCDVGAKPEEIVFNGRFDLELTNSPFSSNVGKDQKVGNSDETRPIDILKAVVTSEYPVFTSKGDRLRAAYLPHLLRADHFKADLQRKASGTSGRKRVRPEGFLNLEIPVPSLDEQDGLLADFARADEMECEAARLRRSAWEKFEATLFTATEESAP